MKKRLGRRSFLLIFAKFSKTAFSVELLREIANLYVKMNAGNQSFYIKIPSK